MSKSISKRGVTTEPRTPLNRERVLCAAVQVADEQGANAVTMRAVASKLGVEAMSLYNHVVNKDDILDGMLDLVIGEIELPVDVGDWREAMRCRALAAHAVFGRHPWVPVLLDAVGSSGPASLRYFDWVLGTLMRAGFSTVDAQRVFSVLDSYIYGFAIQEFNYSALSDISPEERAAALLEYVPPQQYPFLHEMATHSAEVGYDAEADFAFGLEVILDGLERMHRGGAGEDNVSSA